MSESTVRRLVRKAYEEENAEAGLFSDERIRNFFAVMKTLVNDCFLSLYNTVHDEYSGNEREERFARGLAYIANDQNHRLGLEEASRATQEFPTIAHEYERAMVSFAQVMVSTRDPSLKVEVPSFTQFLLKLYKRMAQSIEVRSMRYFRMTYFEQDIYLKDVLRVTMNSCLMLRLGASAPSTPRAPSVVPEPSILAGALASSRTGGSGAGGNGTCGSGGSGSTMARSRQEHRQAHHVLPSDSVSNVPPARLPAAPAKDKRQRPRSMLTTMSEQSSSGSEHSDFSLRKYKQQLQANSVPKKQPPFKQPSFVNTKEVDLTPLPNDEIGELGDDKCASDLLGYSTLSRR